MAFLAYVPGPMPVINHLAIVLSYTLLAATVGVTLPRHVATLDPQLAVWMGAAILLAFGLLHFALARLAHDRMIDARVAALEAAQADTRIEIQAARDEARRIHDAIEAAAMTRQGQIADLGEVMTEVKVLQDLVEQLSVRGRIPLRRPRGAGSVPASAPRAAVAPPRLAEGLEDAELLDIVREGLRSNRVDLFVQPIVSLPQRKHRHLECFSRIRAMDGSMITPEQYLAIAEREGLIGAIDNMLLFRSVQVARRLSRSGNFGLFINISEHTLADADFFREFVAFVAGNREFAPRLVFEFQQAHVSRHGEAVMRDLDRLAQLGCRFSMDQVTSLALDVDELGARHFRFIKLEAGRVLAETSGESRRLDMRAFKGALYRNGIDLIVEKIETEAALVELLDLPVDFGQGYLFGEPRHARNA